MLNTCFRNHAGQTPSAAQTPTGFDCRRSNLSQAVRPGLGWLAACLTMIVGLMVAEPAGADPRAVHTGENVQAPFANWMRWVPDSVPLSALSIPGTHDSMAHYGGPLAQTQTLRLPEQLRAGIRTIDIRARHVENTFSLYHGLAYQNAGFSDVLTACNTFLEQNPSETILLWLSADGVPRPVDVDSTRHYYETFEWYRDQSGLGGRIYIPNSTLSPQLPLGQVRGRIVIIEGFTHRPFALPYGYESKDIEGNGYWDLGDIADMDTKWEAVLAHATKIGGSDDSVMYENSLSGNSSRGGIWPIDVANGILWEEGIAYRYLRYLFTGNQRRTTGLLYTDFPGSGLIASIIAHNLRYATNLSAVGSDFNRLFQEVAYSAAGDGSNAAADRAAQLHNFMRRVLPDQHWAALVAGTAGNDSWGFALEPDGFTGQTSDIDGFSHLIVGSRNLDPTLASLNLSAYWTPATLNPLTGTTTARARSALNLLKSQFPSARWNVAVKRAPFDAGNWSSILDAAISATTIVADEGWVYSYTAWASTGTNRPPVAVPGGPYTVDEGTPVTFTAGQSSDPTDDVLQFRWDLDGDGTWDTDYSYDSTVTHTYPDNLLLLAPRVEVFDGALAVSEKISLDVRNVAPRVNIPSPIALGEDRLLSGEFAIADPGADSWVLNVSYGDGTPRSTLNLTERTFTLNHQYPAAGYFEVSLDVRDDDGARSESRFRVITGTPALEIQRLDASLVRLSWSNHPAPFRLENSTLLPGASWLPVPGNPTLLNGRNEINVGSTNANELFRLTAP